MGCLCCYAVEKYFKETFLEVIYFIEEGEKSPDAVFAELEEKNAATSKCIRRSCWFFTCLGHFLFLIPLIEGLAWIPFIGSLLSMVVGVAALIFALVWGTLLFFLIMCTAWLVYRPILSIIGLTLILVVLIVLNVAFSP